MDELKSLNNIEKTLLAILTLLVDTRERNSDGQQEKTEVLLSNAGLTSPEIAKILRKKASAVQKAIQRSRK